MFRPQRSSSPAPKPRAPDSKSTRLSGRATMNVPVDHLLGMKPTSELLRWMCCVRCGSIPSPIELKTCPQNDFTCGACFRKLREWEQEDWPLKPCCELVKLAPFKCNGLYRHVLQSSLFRCPNGLEGCDKVFAGITAYQEHLQACFKTPYICRYYNCDDLLVTANSLVEHYKKEHGLIATVFDDSAQFHTIDHEDTMKIRLVWLMEFKGNHYLMATEVKKNFLCIWVWDMASPTRGQAKMAPSVSIHLHNYQECTPQEKNLLWSGWVHVLPYKVTTDEVAKAFLVPIKLFESVCVEQIPKGKSMWKISMAFRNLTCDE